MCSPVPLTAVWKCYAVGVGRKPVTLGAAAGGSRALSRPQVLGTRRTRYALHFVAYSWLASRSASRLSNSQPSSVQVELSAAGAASRLPSATSTLCHELEPDFGGSSMIHAQTNSPLCMTRWQSSPLASASFNSGSAQIQAFSLPPLQPNTMVAYWSRVTCR